MSENLRTATNVWQSVFLLALIVLSTFQLVVTTAITLMIFTFLADWYRGWPNLVTHLINALP